MINRNIIREIYFQNDKLTNKDYEKGRKMFLIEGASGTAVFSLTTGAFLAGFANYLGASDSLSGIICSIPTLVCIIQIFSSLVFEKLENRKLLVCILSFIFRLILGIMYFIPILSLGSKGKLALLAIIYGIAYTISAFITPAFSNWIVDLTPNNIRGKFLSQKDAVSLFVSTIITIVLGKVLDVFKEYNQEFMGFIIIGFALIVLGTINFYAMSSAKEPRTKRDTESINLKRIFTEPFKNKRFRKVIYLSIFWNISLQIAGPFFSIYMVNGLQLKYTYIMIMGLLAAIARFFSVSYWGKLADSKSWTFTIKMAVGLLSITHFSWMFMCNDTKAILFPLLNIIGAVAWGGLTIAFFNIQFVYSPSEGRLMYLGMNAGVGGIIGFISTLVGSFILNKLYNFKIYLLKIPVSNMQLLFGISGILLFFCVLYIHIFMKNGEK